MILSIFNLFTKVNGQSEPNALGLSPHWSSTDSILTKFLSEDFDMCDQISCYVSIQKVKEDDNKQTKWMKCQVIGNQIKEEKIWYLH